ncbi:hypothetical protein SAMN05421783_1361, partial [Thiocapsa roseopersicina]
MQMKTQNMAAVDRPPPDSTRHGLIYAHVFRQ